MLVVNTGEVYVDPVATCPVALLFVYHVKVPEPEAVKFAVDPQLIVRLAALGAAGAAATVTVVDAQFVENTPPL